MADAEGALERFEIGRALGNSFAAIARNVGLFAASAALLLCLPLLLFYALLFAVFQDSTPLAMLPILAPAWLALIVCNLVAQIALIRAAIDDLEGRAPRLSACLATGLRLLPRVVAMGLLIILPLLIGLLLLVIPGVILWLGWSVTVPAMVEERAGVFGGLRRSWALTRGSKRRLFLLFLLIVIIVAMISGAFTVASMSFGVGPAGLMLGTVVQAIGSGISGALFSAAIGAAYVELRRAREGGSTDALAEIFA